MGYILADYYVTDNFAYDWYEPTASYAYKYINFTYIRVLENAILIACCYLHRYKKLIQKLSKRT